MERNRLDTRLLRTRCENSDDPALAPTNSSRSRTNQQRLANHQRPHARRAAQVSVHGRACKSLHERSEVRTRSIPSWRDSALRLERNGCYRFAVAVWRATCDRGAAFTPCLKFRGVPEESSPREDRRVKRVDSKSTCRRDAH